MKQITAMTPEYLIKIANLVFGSDALSKSRVRRNVFARTAITVYLREKRMTHDSIGEIFKSNHTASYHYLKQHESGMSYDKNYRDLFAKFESELKRGNNIHDFTLGKCKERVKKINNDLLELGYSLEDMEGFWNECINELKKTA